ncbi:MAG: hypothetical protein KatS3mg028_0445 [Bacteroidia bacterium]|nr:MAG: hypothetical protein KatS3mg028_0445 [Bacteroidia bacterium]
MKKGIVLSVATLAIFGCNKKNMSSEITQTTSSTGITSNLKQNESQKPRLRFKHTGPSKPGEPPPAPCETPLGICFIFGIQENSGPLTKEEIMSGINTAEISILNNNQMKIIPDTVFAYENGTIEIEGNFHVSDVVSHMLGYKKILVKKGTYIVNKNEGKFGSVILNVIATPK